MKLTEAQKRELSHLARVRYSTNIPFRTGEALRRYGLATRETDHLVGADYADKNGVHVQWRRKDNDQPMQRHTWVITSAGRAALDQDRGGNG